MAKTAVKKLTGSRKITTLEIGRVSSKHSFVMKDSEGNDVIGEDNKPVLRIGHFYQFRKTDAGEVIVVAEKFLSNKRVKEFMDGKEWSDDLPKQLRGSKIEFTDLVEVKAGEEFEAWTEDGSPGDINKSEKDMILFSDMFLDCTLTQKDKQMIMFKSVTDHAVANISQDKLDNFMSEFGL